MSKEKIKYLSFWRLMLQSTLVLFTVVTSCNNPPKSSPSQLSDESSTGESNDSIVSDMIEKLPVIDSIFGSNISIKYGSRNRENGFITIGDFYRSPTGYVIAEFTTGNKVNDISYEYCDLPNKYPQKMVSSVCTEFFNLDVLILSLDSSKNVYFSVSNPEKYEYVLVRDSNALLSEYSYIKNVNNCFKMKANFD